ncbi:uncharacterized protein [Populus alba]|uniref:RIN4 pathogenic type III effector avirulence factor Avr cleavage site domain-containing protein n=2 Tax=Populus TaxID=3689 RepID=A0A8X7Z3H2_POPTO|nr:uncharacterized protein LOC118027639 [Populus alba]KAG6762434.1 hypothetical protein POTOM_032934 [Populus tomentosa]
MYLCADNLYSQSYFHRLIMAMGEKNGGLSVPQFGAWDSKNPVPTNYSMVFTRARANRKQHKSDVRHASLGNERELLAAACQQEEPVIKRKKILTYIHCCTRP